MCQHVVPAKTPANRVTIETREKKYPHRVHANVVVYLEDGKRKVRKVDDPGGHGREIVREIVVCPTCSGKTVA